MTIKSDCGYSYVRPLRDWAGDDTMVGVLKYFTVEFQWLNTRGRAARGQHDPTRNSAGPSRCSQTVENAKIILTPKGLRIDAGIFSNKP